MLKVNEFIKDNYVQYEGDSSFLKGATDRTKVVLQKLEELMKLENEKGGVLDAETARWQSIIEYGPGYIDKDRELIVGLQTDKPLKCAIFPKGGIRTVENALKAYGYTPDTEFYNILNIIKLRIWSISICF
jgi:formate C-acetyltransferase